MIADRVCLVDGHDCLLLDLDGTVFRGSLPTPGAVETLATVGARTLFLTNNASRSAEEVAKHLCGLGLAVHPGDVVTSAQSAARAISARLPGGSKVLVVGTEALAAETARVGLQPVRSYSDAPVAVLQGHSPHTGWADLAEATLAIRGGALWVATNADVTLPSDRGLVPGNGSMVAALRAATGVEPEVVGKPAAAMIRDALATGTFHSPLVVGDRLDTDIAGANAAGLPSVVVLTGVSTTADLLFASDQQRPTYLAEDLRGLFLPAVSMRIGPQSGWHVQTGDDAVTVTSTGGSESLSAVRAALDAAWRNGVFRVRAGDKQARDALRQWGLV
ncbi:HAD-IIA family hydrolase [Mycobacterium xenopi]|uniref:Hydrolase n=2 Tax=Mycobacterium xenopi TaxID=1789 RepID=A0AAD1GX22_MYCXE|nr:HAD-IIA family hydrolase [Mycobacterium xenopi]EUA23611.1 HAD hydrolase, IIA family protein [Mycobacterium xenopi 4042]EUA52023.1 HAD hydrolase, IIA family protein [Mycobacterium xenopi 3993]MDA3641635.1 HAD-IIA family hydrolase [Mycobacterium xenopi]MDA3659393.1 HAD-IIA family hydrolase [Mycobacterium xenopi]MDA3663855.1 HAD-IIA family hydrolase [Mycobacterium xenopi]